MPGPATTNFEACASLVMSPNITLIHRQWFAFTDSSRPWLLTLGGRKEACGAGVERWTAQDTLFRFTLWILPAIVLIGHFHFPPLSIWNTINVVVHLFGDPIDSMWSMLTRHEVNRRLYRRAIRLSKSLRFDEQVPRQPFIEAIAGIWTVYDELGWGGVSPDILEAFERKGADVSPHEIFYVLRASHRLTSNRSSSELGTWIAILGMFCALFAAYIRTWMQKLENQTAHTIAIVSMLFTYMPIVKISGDIGAFNSSSDAVDTILELRQDLRACSTRSMFLELFPVLEFYPEMPWRKKIWRDQTLEVESGLAKSITQESVTERVITEFVDQDPQDQKQITPELQRQIQRPVFEVDLPTLHPESQHTPSQKEKNAGASTVPSFDPTASWLEVAPSLGMNMTFRPPKSISLISTAPGVRGDRPPYLLLSYSMAFIIIGSYTPAFLLSYFTFWTVGFGCRCLAWTLILSLWLLSLLADTILQYNISSARKLWHTTVAKDAFIAAFFVGTIVWLQVGWVNSCWCRSKAIGLGDKAVVDLAPVSGDQWNKLWILWPLAPLLGVAFTVGLYWWVSSGARMVLCKDPKKRHRNLLVISELRKSL